jgi:hypothetical protein
MACQSYITSPVVFSVLVFLALIYYSLQAFALL